MKQQVNPVMAVVAVVVAAAVVGLVVYFISSRSEAPATPTKTIATPAPLKGTSPDEQIKMRMQQMQQGGSGGQ